MFTIGLTGMSGSGKSTVAKLFAEHNVFYINADEVYHDMVSQSSPCLDALVREFGAGIISASGALDRSSLRDIVFSDDLKLKKLNTISHQFVLNEIRAKINEISCEEYSAVLVDAPQLFESGFDSECDTIISVIANEATRVKRIVERDGITEEAAKKRLSLQHTDDYFNAHSDFVIVNDQDIDSLSETVNKIIKKIILT